MTREIIFFLLGLVLLWTPRSWLRLGKPEVKRTKRKTTTGGANRDRQPGDQSFWASEEFARRRNWLDFGRAVAGGTAVFFTVPTLVGMWIDVPGMQIDGIVLVTQAVIMLTGVVIQMIRIEERLSLFPPVFFICGLALPVVGIKAALIAFVSIWAINAILPNPAIFLTAYAGGVVILSILLGRGTEPAVVMAILAAFPPLVSVLFRRRLAQYRKRTKIVVR